jgi:hypothetical protein
LSKDGRVLLNINFVGEGEVGFKKPGGEITKGSQGKFIYGIIVKNVIQGSKTVKENYYDSERDNKCVFISKVEKIKKVFVPAGINRIRIRGRGNKGHYHRNPDGFSYGQ